MLIAELGYMEETSKCSGICTPLSTTVFALNYKIEPEVSCKEVI